MKEQMTEHQENEPAFTRRDTVIEGDRNLYYYSFRRETSAEPADADAGHLDGASSRDSEPNGKGDHV